MPFPRDNRAHREPGQPAFPQQLKCQWGVHFSLVSHDSVSYTTWPAMHFWMHNHAEPNSLRILHVPFCPHVAKDRSGSRKDSKLAIEDISVPVQCLFVVSL